MGTSSSFGGPNDASQLIPAFVSDEEPVLLEPLEPADANDDEPAENRPTPALIPKPVAPSMSNARANFSDFARHGHRQSLERSIRYYVGQGLGGAKTGGQRMARTARSGALVGNFLRTVARDGLKVALSTLHLESLAGLPFESLFAAIIDAVLPATQTIDDDIGRQALFDALIALSEAGSVDLANLSLSDVRLFFAKFVCSAITHRYMADVAAAGLSLAQSDFSYESLQGQVSDFIEAAVSSEINKALENDSPLDEQFADRTITRVFEAAWTLLESVGLVQSA